MLRSVLKGVSLETTLGEYRSKRVHSGDIGIEIECEGKLVEIHTDYWNTVGEGSLRGGMEYVLSLPISIKHLPLAMEEWSQATKTCKFKQSFRTSVHVHVNVGRFTLREIYNVIACFWILEPLLVRMHGKEREGNLFCLRAGDAEDQVYTVCREIMTRDYFSQSGDNSRRYSSLNISSLWKFGSLEFRFMKGTTDPREIQTWAEELYNFVHIAKITNLTDFLSNLYTAPAKEILYNFFSIGFVNEIFKHTPPHEARNLLMEGYCYSYRLAKALEEKTRPVIQSDNEDLIQNSIFVDSSLEAIEDEEELYSFEEPPHVEEEEFPNLHWNVDTHT